MQKPSNQIFSKFVGTWHLVECIQTDAQGNISYPFGQDAIGYLIYTLEGIMAVQIMRKNRKVFTENLAERELAKDYNAYFGHYEIDEANKIVIHTLEGNLNANQIGIDKIRNYNFYDDKLSLITQEAPITKLIWQNVVA